MRDIWKIGILIALAAVAALFTGCGESSSSAEQTTTSRTAGPPGESIGRGSGELNCETFPFDNSGSPGWRQDSYSFGPFGVSHNYAAGNREPDGFFHSKTPMLVEGHRTVVVSVPKSERDRVGIQLLKPHHPILTLTLQPCADKRRTTWAAGFVLRDVRPVILDVRVGSRRGTVMVGPPETRR